MASTPKQHDATQTEIRREIRIAAPPETVFQYFVDPDRLAKWIGQAIEIDARPGGTMRLLVAGQHTSGGQFVEVDPPRRLVYTMGWDEPNHPIPPGSTRVEINLAPDADGTVLTFRHLGLPSDAVDDHTHGWTHYLGRLQIAAAGGDPGPDSNAAHQPAGAESATA